MIRARPLLLMLMSGALAQAVAATGAAAASEGELAIGARAASDYMALRQRPLFSPDRSPPLLRTPEPVVEAVASPTPPEPLPEAAPPNWQLVGLVRSERVNSATFRTAGSPAFSLRKGETRDGWTLAEIGRFEVFIDGGGGRARIGFPSP